MSTPIPTYACTSTIPVLNKIVKIPCDYFNIQLLTFTVNKMIKSCVQLGRMFVL